MARGRRGGSRSRPPVWLERLLFTSLIFAVVGVLSTAVVFWWFGRDLPTVAQLRDYRPPETNRFLDRSGETIGESFAERRTVVPLSRLPRLLVLCILAAEDADFYSHEGLDYSGILRALLKDVVLGRAAQGASTITQQVVKLLLLNPERTITRKIRELILARRLERHLSKDEILHLYVNHINFGHGRYGVQEASRLYFGKDVSELGLAEASLIAGIPQSPARLSPLTHPAAARRRQLFVLRQLENKRDRWPDVSLDQVQAARDARPSLEGRGALEMAAPEVVVSLSRVLRDVVGADRWNRGGFAVHTTFDVDLQRQVRRATRRALHDVDARHGYRGPLRRRKRRLRYDRPRRVRLGRSYLGQVAAHEDDDLLVTVGDHRVRVPIPPRYNPKGLTPRTFAPKGAPARISFESRDPGSDGVHVGRLELGPQAAVVSLDNRTREVLAMVGAYEAVPGFNRAMGALRQPGSTFKPFTYAAAIRSRKYTPATLVVDAPSVYEKWRPQNYETWNYRGNILLRDALAQSVNMVAVRVIEDVGPGTVTTLAHRAGISSDLDSTFALALGASEVRVHEMANAYATFAAGGRWEPLRMVRRVEDRSGRAVSLPAEPEPVQVLEPEEAFVVTSLLESVINRGTGRGARALGRPAAGKTGTSNRAKDAWFVGYTPGVTTAVWVGFDDSRPLGRGESGGRAAVPLWVDVMRAAIKDRPRADFVQPPGVERAMIDPETGLLAHEGMEGAREEVFVEGTAPRERAARPDEPSMEELLMEQLAQ